MDDVIHLIEHLLAAKFSIDRLESIIDQLKISRDDLLRLLRADRYKDYFQLLRPTKSCRNSASEKVTLTLDVSIQDMTIEELWKRLALIFSCSVVHITPKNVRIDHVPFYTCVLTMFDRCMANVRIEHVRMTMTFWLVRIIRRSSKRVVCHG